MGLKFKKKNHKTTVWVYMSVFKSLAEGFCIIKVLL